ncbi:hypothetical protein C7S17_0791 [Burkholderia thailandensis]|nr:hypothetical protein [Burkholderia thailandensis]
MSRTRRIVASVAAVVMITYALNSAAFISLVLPVGRALLWTGRYLSGTSSLAAAESVVAWERSIALHGAVIGALWWATNSDKSKNGEEATIWMPLDTEAVRENPDPKRYDDAARPTGPTAASMRDAKPKTSYAGEADRNATSTPPNGEVAASMPAGGSSSYAVSGENTIREYRSVDISLYSGLGDLQRCSAAQAATNPGSGWSFSCPSGRSSDGKTVGIWFRNSAQKACAEGYVLTSGSCLLSNAAAVKKPPGKVPCEVLVDPTDNSFQFDAANPSCSSLLSQFSKPAKNQLRYQNPSGGGYDIVTRNADGSVTVETSDGTNYKKISVGAFDKDQGGGAIKGIDTGPQPGSDGTGSGNTGSGGSGNGSGNCGGPGQSACAVTVDDSGFGGKDAQVSSAADAIRSKLDERQAFIESKASSADHFGLDNSWIPSLLPGSPVTCSNLKWEPGISHGPLSGLSTSVEIDWCSKIDVFREYYAWLVGVATLIAIVMLFFGSNGNTGRSIK